MNESILSDLDKVRKALPSTLVDDSGYERLAKIAAMMPFELGNFWGLEARLGRPEAFADILFEIKNKTQGQRLLAGLIPSCLDTLFEKWPAWKQLRALAKLWANPDHPFHNNIKNIWLEFDTESLTSNSSIDEILKSPSVFFGPETGKLEKEQLFGLVQDFFKALGQKHSLDSQLQSFIASLPEGAKLFQVGLMLGRPSRDLRVCVNHIAPDAVPDWLSGLNWHGDVDATAKLLKKINPMISKIAIDLNLTENGAENKIGIECYLDRIDGDPKKWQPLLDFLENHNQCLPSKSKGFLDFPGNTPSLLFQKKSSGTIMKPGIFRMIHHIKISIIGNKVMDAKAYLALYRPGLRINEIFSKPVSSAGDKESEKPDTSWLSD